MVVVIIEGGNVQAVYGEDVVVVDFDTEGFRGDVRVFNDAYVNKVEPNGPIPQYLTDIFYEAPELMTEVSRLTGVNPHD